MRSEKNSAIPFSFASKEKLLEALALTGILEPVVQELEKHLKAVSLKANQLLVEHGQVNTDLYYVLSGGFVCRFMHGDDDAEKTINFYLNELHPIMACLDSIFSGTPTMCELRAIADSEVLSISKHRLDVLIEQDAKLKGLFDALLITALIEENDLKLKIISCKPKTLYQYLMQEMPVVIQKVPSKYIAEFMGISAEWLSKIKGRKSIS